MSIDSISLAELTTISGLRINSFTAQTPSWEPRLGISSRLGYSSRAARFPYDDSVGVRTQSSFGMYCVCYSYTYFACGVEGVAMIFISSIMRKNDDLSFDIAELYMMV